MASGRRVHHSHGWNVGKKTGTPARWQWVGFGALIALITGFLVWQLVLPRLNTTAGTVPPSSSGSSSLVAADPAALKDPSHPPCSKYIASPEAQRLETTLAVDLTKDGVPAFLEFLILPAEQTALLDSGTLKPVQALQTGDKVRIGNGNVGIIQSVETKAHTPEVQETDQKGNGFRRVLAKSKRWTETILKLHTAREVIETTPEHPFYVNGQWIEAKNLQPGQQIKTKNGAVSVSKIETAQDPQFVYNLLVEGAHNFYVGSDGLLAHNCTPNLLKPVPLKGGATQLPDDVVWLRIDEIDHPPWNPPDVASKYQNAKDIITREGYDPQHAILVVKEPNGRYSVMNGNHRLAAVRDLGYDGIPVRIR